VKVDGNHTGPFTIAIYGRREKEQLTDPHEEFLRRFSLQSTCCGGGFEETLGSPKRGRIENPPTILMELCARSLSPTAGRGNAAGKGLKVVWWVSIQTGVSGMILSDIRRSSWTRRERHNA